MSGPCGDDAGGVTIPPAGSTSNTTCGAAMLAEPELGMGQSGPADRSGRQGIVGRADLVGLGGNRLQAQAENQGGHQAVKGAGQRRITASLLLELSATNSIILDLIYFARFQCVTSQGPDPAALWSNWFDLQPIALVYRSTSGRDANPFAPISLGKAHIGFSEQSATTRREASPARSIPTFASRHFDHRLAHSSRSCAVA